MARRKNEGELPLFDLPLRGDDGTQHDEESGAGRGETLGQGPSELGDPLDDDLPVENDPPPVADEPPRSRGLFDALEEELGEELDHDLTEDLDEESGGIASPVDRLLAGLADIGVHLVMVAACAVACVVVGVPVTASDWPPFVGLALVLSFLYWIIPLAFWGQTPGMAWIGNVARSDDDEPLSFGQAVLRWVGALISLILLGFPLLMAFGGRSLSDRLSDSKTEVF